MKYFMRVLMILLSIPLLILSGCDDFLSHKGPYDDLNCVVTNSILGFYGVDYNKIVIMEEDSYGRKMFVNFGQSVAASDQLDAKQPAYIYSILISQKTVDGFVYYYPDCNFIVYKIDHPQGHIPTEELLQYVHDLGIEEDINWLKQNNDWEKTIDESKCVKSKVSKRTREYESNTRLVSKEAKEKVYEQVFPQATYNPGIGVFSYLTSDTYDRHIYFFRGLQADGKYTESYVVMFNKDGSFDSATGIMEITDLWHYQEVLRGFKERNGWNTPVG